MRGWLFVAVCILTGLAVGTLGSRWLLEQQHAGRTASSGSVTEPEAGSDSSAQGNSNLAVTSEAPLTDPVPDPPAPSAAVTEAAPESTPGPRAHSYHDGIMRVAPAVVSLYAEGGELPASQGSGVIIDSNGIILTNLHLLQGHRAISVVLADGREFAAALIGDDPETDLAVVSIEASNLPAIPLTPSRQLLVGDIVLTIGNPFGVGQTVTQGIVSATQRRVAGGSAWQNFVQIDAPINPGNSGGALITPDGALAGITTAVFRGNNQAEGIGYAIPTPLLAQVVPQITENGYVARGWLGVSIDDISLFPALQELGVEGVLVSNIVPDSPADAAGLKSRDIVLQIGEKSVHDVNDLLLTISALPPGATVKITVLRGVASAHQSPARQLEQLDLKARLGTRPLSGSTSARNQADAPASGD